MANQTLLQIPPYLRPFASEDTVNHCVAYGPVPPRPMMADHAILFSAQGLDRPLRDNVKIIRAQADHLATESVEGVLEKLQLATGVDVTSLPTLSVPRMAEL